MYKKIAVAVDGSDNSMRAVAQAVDLAKLIPDCEVIVLSVIAIDVYSDMVYDPIEAHGESQTELVEPALRVLKENGINAKIELVHGRPADEIVRYTKNNGVDLRIIGSRGLNVLQEFAIGSVSHKVIKHCECPALVVK
jgi:nucleotide-binding universal stress UspA family protein